MKQRILFALKVLVSGFKIGKDQVSSLLETMPDSIRNGDPQALADAIKAFANEVGAELTYQQEIRRDAALLHVEGDRLSAHVRNVEHRRDQQVDRLRERIEQVQFDARQEIAGTSSEISRNEGSLKELSNMASRLGFELEPTGA